MEFFAVTLLIDHFAPFPSSSPLVSFAIQCPFSSLTYALSSLLQILKLTLYTYIDPAVPPIIARIESALLPFHRLDFPPLPLDPFASYTYFDPLPNTTYEPTQDLNEWTPDLNEWFATAMAAFEGSSVSAAAGSAKLSAD